MSPTSVDFFEMVKVDERQVKAGCDEAQCAVLSPAIARRNASRKTPVRGVNGRHFVQWEF